MLSADPTYVSLETFVGHPEIAGYPNTADVAVANTGTKAASGLTVSTSAVDWNIASTTCQRKLAVGDTCTVTVAFTPTTPGLNNATLVVTAGKVQVSVSLSGLGRDLEGLSCDDGDSTTWNDQYTNGVCAGTTIPDGTTCTDWDTTTVGDQYLNGVCTPGPSKQNLGDPYCDYYNEYRFPMGKPVLNADGTDFAVGPNNGTPVCYDGGGYEPDELIQATHGFVTGLPVSACADFEAHQQLGMWYIGDGPHPGGASICFSATTAPEELLDFCNGTDDNVNFVADEAFDIGNFVCEVGTIYTGWTQVLAS